jgi:hypothetical protein
MLQHLKRLAMVVVLVGLTGCATPLVFETHVSAFHRMAQPKGLTYAMVPFREQQGSLEHASYAQMVSAELKRHGMVEVAESHQAAVAVFIRYGIDNGTQVRSTYPIIGQTGVAGSTTTGTVNRFGSMASVNATTTYTPTYGVVGSGTRTDTIYKRFFDLEVVEMASLSSGTPKKLYEGKALSSGSSPQLARVMPYMVESVFKEFPGPSPQTKAYRISEKTK